MPLNLKAQILAEPATNRLHCLHNVKHVTAVVNGQGKTFLKELISPQQQLRRVNMAVDAHLAELSEKHSNLERRIAEEMTRPLSDSLKIAELKRQKLKLKDEITRLQGRSTAFAH